MRDFIESDFPNLLDLLYDAALDPGRWQVFLDRLGSCFGGANGILHSFDKDKGVTNLSFQFGSDPAYAASYADHYWHLNPYPRLAVTLPVGRALPATTAGTQLLHKTEFFNDWMKPQGIPVDHLGVLLAYDGSQGVVMGVALHASIYHRNRKRYGRQLDLLIPHVTRALEINRVTSAARLAEQSLGGTLEALGVAAFLVGHSGRLLLANTEAETLMRAERVVTVDGFKTLRATRMDDDKALSAAIAAAIVATEHDRQPLRLTSCGSGRAWAAWVLPVRPPRNKMPSRRLELFSGVGQEPTALVLLTPVGAGIAIPAGAIQAGVRAVRSRSAARECAGCRPHAGRIRQRSGPLAQHIPPSLRPMVAVSSLRGRPISRTAAALPSMAGAMMRMAIRLGPSFASIRSRVANRATPL